MMALLVTPLAGASAQSANPVGAFAFEFRDEPPQGPRNIEVMAVAGSSCRTKACPLVIAMHGVTRNAFQTRDNWLKLAEVHQILVVAPYIDRERFPTRLYQQGGVVGEADRTRWLYPMIERLYDHLVASGRATNDGYLFFGHSAGAQFVHRFVLAMPQARFRLAIAGNAGFYTLPTDAGPAGGFPFPYSMEGTPLTIEERKAALARPLVIMLGDQDNDPNHHQLNNTDGAKAQGPHRFARGQFYFAAAETEAKRLGVPFAWKKIVVPGVDHDNIRMAAAAAAFAFAK
jgi:poly(3-hydroxybutyrate) depolymerase